MDYVGAALAVIPFGNMTPTLLEVSPKVSASLVWFCDSLIYG